MTIWQLSRGKIAESTSQSQDKCKIMALPFTRHRMGFKFCNTQIKPFLETYTSDNHINICSLAVYRQNAMIFQKLQMQDDHIISTTWFFSKLSGHKMSTESNCHTVSMTSLWWD